MRKIIIYTFLLTLFTAVVSLLGVEPVRAATSISACGILSTANETYVLTQDVSSDGTCFVISANYITLDLNGHTVTYGNAAASYYYGVAIPMSYYNSVSQTIFPGLPPEAFKGAQHVTIMNGTINQGSGGGEKNHAVYARPGNYETVHDTTSTVYSKDSQNIIFHYGHDNNLYNNTAYNNVTSITSRYQGHEVIGTSSDSGNTKIHGNTIIGGPQYGIRIAQNDATAAGFEIYDNNVSQNAKVANPYGISVHVNNAKVYNNTITPQNGRGFHLAGCSNVEVYNNTVTVMEGVNPEYSPGWSHGIKVENGTNLKIYNNTVTAYAGTVGGKDFGHAYALDLTMTSGADTHNEIYNNTFMAITSASNRTAVALHLVDVRAGNAAEIHNNIFRSNNYNVMFDYDSGSEVYSRSNTFELTGTPINYHTLNFYTGPTASISNIFLNSSVAGGASLKDITYRPAGAGFGYKIQNYLNLTVLNANGPALTGADVVVKDKFGNTQATGVTDSVGKLSMALTATDVTGKPLVSTDLSPYTVSISKLGFVPAEAGFNIEQSQNLEISLTATDAPPPAPSCMQNWTCQEWSACVNGERTRTCSDSNSCGVITERPALVQACQISPNCLEDWSCSAWSACSDNQQTRTCTDRNGCGTTTSKPRKTFNCASGQSPTPSDDIAPNTQITTSPPALQASKKAEFAWLGVDDQTAASDLLFSYKLDSNDWSKWSDLTDISFNDLRNGTHSFSVRVRDKAGNIDASQAQVQFRIQKEPLIVVGQRQGGSQVRLFDNQGRLVKSFRAFESKFVGGISVAMGDLGGDEVDEIIIGSGPGRKPEVEIFRRNGTLINKFMAYSAGMTKGLMVATGDVNGDGKDEIITSPMAGAGPEVRIFGYRKGKFAQIFPRFNAYSSSFRGGVSITAGDVNGDGKDEIITSQQSGSKSEIKAFALVNGRFRQYSLSFLAYPRGFVGGSNLAVGQLNSSLAQEIIAGPGRNYQPQVKTFYQNNNRFHNLNTGLLAYKAAFRSGVSVASADVDMDGTDEIITAPAAGSDAIIKIYKANGKTLIRSFRAFPKTFRAGVRIASGE